MKEDKVEILSCPCCGKIPTIRHAIAIEGGEAYIECRCGLSMECWDDFNSYLAEKKAIQRWNKTAENRKTVKTEREDE